MHWLAEHIESLHELANRHSQYRELSAKKVAGSEAAEKQARSAFRTELRELIKSIAEKKGIDACFASHEGLLVDSSGDAGEFEALAAIAQGSIEAGAAASSSLQLGKLRQMVIVGDEKKLALFWIGQIALGILCPVETHLAQQLSN